MNWQALQELRTKKANITEDGIFLVYRSRYIESVDLVAKLVAQQPDAYIAERTTARERNGRPAKVVFTISAAADAYVVGRISVAEAKAWEATS